MSPKNRAVCLSHDFLRNFPAVNRCEKVCFRGLPGPENSGIFGKFRKFSKISGNFPEIFPPKIGQKTPKCSREITILQSGKFPEFPEFPGGISGGFPGDFRRILDNFRSFLQQFALSYTLDYSRKFVFLMGCNPLNFQLFTIFGNFCKNFQKFPKFFSAGTFFGNFCQNLSNFPKFRKFLSKSVVPRNFPETPRVYFLYARKNTAGKLYFVMKLPGKFSGTSQDFRGDKNFPRNIFPKMLSQPSDKTFQKFCKTFYKKFL
jgi:hypothetical protein